MSRIWQSNDASRFALMRDEVWPVSGLSWAFIYFYNTIYNSWRVAGLWWPRPRALQNVSLIRLNESWHHHGRALLLLEHNVENPGPTLLKSRLSCLPEPWYPPWDRKSFTCSWTCSSSRCQQFSSSTLAPAVGSGAPEIQHTHFSYIMHVFLMHKLCLSLTWN